MGGIPQKYGPGHGAEIRNGESRVGRMTAAKVHHAILRKTRSVIDLDFSLENMLSAFLKQVSWTKYNVNQSVRMTAVW
jgi:hypothetical protein